MCGTQTCTGSCTWGSCSEGDSPDSYENDDSSGQANLIWVNADRQTHNLFSDADWFKFYGSNDLGFCMETDNLGGSCDTTITLYDTDGTTQLDYDDDSGPGVASSLCYGPMATSQVYYFKVDAYGSSYGCYKDYDVRMWAWETEPNDSCASADTEPWVGGGFNILILGRISSSTDFDYYEFYEYAGRTITVVLGLWSVAPSYNLFIMEPTCTTSVRGCTVNGGSSCTINYTIPSNGWYKILIMSSEGGSSSNQYELYLTLP